MGSYSQKYQNNHAVFVFFLGLVLSISIMASAVSAEEFYEYDKNHSFYSTWFMAAEMPVVTHDNTKKYCNQDCHWTFFPGLLPKHAWEEQMSNLSHHFGKAIVLEPSVKKDIEEYLTKHAAEFTESKYSVKILDSLKGRTPYQITSIRFITKTHHDVKRSVFRRNSIGGFSNCPACHQGVEQTGNFKEKFVKIPE